MLDWITILVLLITGISLIVIELIFIPGTTIFGLAGVVLSVIGIVVAFINHGFTIGILVLLSSFACTALAIFYSVQSGTWEKVSLKGSNKNRVNDQVNYNIWKGDTGKTVSALRPGGKATFNDKIVEVSSQGRYVSAGTTVKVVDVDGHRIVVEPVSID